MKMHGDDLIRLDECRPTMATAGLGNQEVHISAIKLLLFPRSHSLSSEFRSAYPYVDFQSISHIAGPVDLNHIFILFMRIVIRFVQTEN